MESKTTDPEEEVSDVETLDVEAPRAAFSALNNMNVFQTIKKIRLITNVNRNISFILSKNLLSSSLAASSQASRPEGRHPLCS